jgi:hypothetical protein
MACFPLTRIPRYAMPNSSLHPAFAALPSAHPARGVVDELRWGPISMRVCTTCFAPLGPREVTGALPLLFCGDRFLLARPVPSSSPMACIAHVRGLGSHSCFARPYHAARCLGSQALRQCAVVAPSVLDAPSRHGCRRHPSSEGRLGELHMRTATECAPPPLEHHSGAARAPPPESAGGRAGEGLKSDAVARIRRAVAKA